MQPDAAARQLRLPLGLCRPQQRLPARPRVQRLQAAPRRVRPGRLRKGMIVDYADANGRVQRYAVAWWKVDPPDRGGRVGMGTPGRPEHDPPDVRRGQQRVPADGPAGSDRLTFCARSWPCARVVHGGPAGPMIGGDGRDAVQSAPGRPDPRARRARGCAGRASEGEPAVVLVGGDAGLGKTRLVTEFTAFARIRRHSRADRCLPRP